MTRTRVDGGNILNWTGSGSIGIVGRWDERSGVSMDMNGCCGYGVQDFGLTSGLDGKKGGGAAL